MASILSDLRLGYRNLLKSPGFTLAAVLTLALGLGGNIAVFSVANALFLRPAPLVEAPGRLAWILGVERETARTHPVSYPDALDLADLHEVFAGVLAETRVELNFTGASAPSRISGLVVSGNYFSVLGVRPALGRGFLAEEDRTPGTHPVVVLSDALWRREFGADTSVVGRPVTINARPFTVVGVMPPGFIGAELGERPADVYVPVMMAGQAAPQLGDALHERGSWMFSLIGRLQPGMSMERAAAAVRTVADSQPRHDAAGDTTTTFRLQPMSGSIHPNDRAEGLTIGVLGLAVAGVVLLIACANVAALLLGRATARRREMAVRLALGAGRRRLARQLLTESLLLALLAAAGGVLLSAWITSAALVALEVPVPVDVSPDARVVLVALGLAVAAALLFGTAPALAASHTEIAPALSDGTPASGMPRARRRLQRAFVVAQIALSLMLLATGMLLLRAMQAATTANVGFDASNRVLSLSFDLAAQGYAPDRVRQMSDLLMERVAALPGARAAAIAGLVPLGGVMWGTTAQVEDAESSAARPIGMVFMNPVRPGFFRTIGLRLPGGRDFSKDDDQGAPAVGIVSETMARSAWPGQNPIGRRFRLGSESAPWITVVGVAGDTVDGPGEDAQPFVYLPLLQRQWPSPQSLLVRADGPAAPLAAAVTAEVRRLDATLPVFHVATLEDVVRERLLPRRAGAAVVTTFGLLALGLAAIGLYGVVSSMVVQRRREIGIRMALGADHSAVTRMVLGEGLRVATVGCVAGLALGAAATTLLASMFSALRAFDPATWALPVLVVLGTVLAASFLPARRAARLDPMETLRTE